MNMFSVEWNGDWKRFEAGGQVDYLARWEVKSLSTDDGGNDNKEEWMGHRL